MNNSKTQIGGSHYKKLSIGPIQYSMANNLDAMQHTAIKYITRFRDKAGIEDLYKAKDMLDQLIEHESSVQEVKMVETLVEDIERVNKKYDYIVTEGRGGLWAAAQLGYALDLKVFTRIGLVTLEGDHILYIDDICDTGQTLAKLNPDWDTAVLVNRVGEPKKFHPTYSGQNIAHKYYVLFPISQRFDSEKQK